jgi:disulfide bond formation protein DsbB
MYNDFMTRLQQYFLCFHMRVMGKLCLLVGLASIVLQALFELTPCTLCLIQRYAFILVGLILIATYIFQKRCRLAGLALALIPSLLGLFASGRQIMLEYLPPSQRPACVPNLEYLVKVFGAYEGARRFLYSSGGCGKVDFTILGISLAHYGFLMFAILVGYIFWAMRYREQPTKNIRQF